MLAAQPEPETMFLSIVTKLKSFQRSRKLSSRLILRSRMLRRASKNCFCLSNGTSFLLFVSVFQLISSLANMAQSQWVYICHSKPRLDPIAQSGHWHAFMQSISLLYKFASRSHMSSTVFLEDWAIAMSSTWLCP